MEQVDFVLEQLNDQGLVILQPKRGYRFSVDAVLLARFATVKENFRILDLGTGSGVIPLLLSTRAKKLQIQGVEIQKSLATLAQKSVALNEKQDTINILEADLNNLSEQWKGKWDLVVSNPPYFKVNSGKVSLGEKAIARHELTCSLKDVINVAAKMLKVKGYFALVHRAERLPEALLLASQAGLVPSRLKLIYPKEGKSAALFLLETVKGTAQTLKILPPLLVYGQAGQYSEEMVKIYAGENMQDGE